MKRARTTLLATLTVTIALSGLGPDLRAQRQRPYETGLWRRVECPEGFVIHETRHYQIQSQAGMEKAKRLGKHMETMFKVYYKCFNPRKRPSKKQPIKLFKNRAQYLKYGAPPGTAGYFSWVDAEMVCYDTGKWMDDQDADDGFSNDEEADLLNPDYFRKIRAKYQMDILGVAAHEGWHQYFQWMVVSKVQLPSWLNEGMGDYFYSARPKRVKGRKMPAELGRMNHARLPIVKLAVHRQKYVPIKELIHYSKPQYYANGSICYAQGWALCQFLMHHENIRYREIIPKFVFLVKNDSNLEAVTDKVFKRIDLDKLDKEWRDWVVRVRMDGTLRKEGEAAQAAVGKDDKTKGQ
jgi:hypothetical protein